VTQPLVSIIIPTYNRANLLPETLDSIIAQTYQNWECLVIDDGSTENNWEILTQYQNKDERFRIFKRENFQKPKGANACRNIGIEMAMGDFIVFFDSDDLMLPNHLETKFNTINQTNFDFCIFKSSYIHNPVNAIPINYRGLFSLPVTAENYCTQKINWLTFDTIINSKLSKIRFNENLQANQEYNYYCKLTLESENAKAFDIVLTHKRFDENSIQGGVYKNRTHNEKRLIGLWETYKDISSKANKVSKRFLLNRIVEIIYREKKIFVLNKFSFYKELFKQFKVQNVLYKIFIIEYRLLKNYRP